MRTVARDTAVYEPHTLDVPGSLLLTIELGVCELRWLQGRTGVAALLNATPFFFPPH